MVAHDFQLEFLPAENGLLDQNFVHRAEVEAPADFFLKLLAVVSDPRARPPERERRPDDERESQLLGCLMSRLNRRHHDAFRNVQPDSLHGVFEPQPVFGHFNRP